MVELYAILQPDPGKPGQWLITDPEEDRTAVVGRMRYMRGFGVAGLSLVLVAELADPDDA
jgi:hypothetical protein